MYKCKLATTKENLLFLENHCSNPERRARIIKTFRVDVEAYEELPPWHGVYNATGSDVLLKDSVIMLKVSDLAYKVKYYPVFSEKLGSKLLKSWGYTLPPKLTAFATDGDNEANLHCENASLRHLLAFARLFMLSQNHLHIPMAYGFNNLYMQLHEYPESGVCPETLRLVNEILGDFIKNNKDGYYINCVHLQDFIDYITNKYKLLPFKDSDFSPLRSKFLAEYPDEKLYF